MLRIFSSIRAISELMKLVLNLGRHMWTCQHRLLLRLHQILEQLYTSLKAWETSVKSNTSLTGHFLPDRDYRQEERAVNVASIAFEEFHVKLGHLAASQA